VEWQIITITNARSRWGVKLKIEEDEKTVEKSSNGVAAGGKVSKSDKAEEKADGEDQEVVEASETEAVIFKNMTKCPELCYHISKLNTLWRPSP
jgi:hypothetical protein